MDIDAMTSSLDIEDIPQQVVPDHAPHPEVNKLEQFYTVGFHSVRSFKTDRADENHLYGWMKFQWEVDPQEGFFDHYFASEMPDKVKFWYTTRYVKVPKDGIPEVPFDG